MLRSMAAGFTTRAERVNDTEYMKASEPSAASLVEMIAPAAKGHTEVARRRLIRQAADRACFFPREIARLREEGWLPDAWRGPTRSQGGV
jgi:hypothetical protein